MKLLRCRIDNFGKLTNFTYDFKEGINTIEEENGWGKSTLAAFLKAMFYGFDTKKEAGAIEKERTLYFPWQGGAYGGELDFEVRGKQYRITRTFGKTEKTDEFKLYDLSTNLESNDYSANIGEELFDLDRASFKRSIYIAQKDCTTTSSDAINAKLGDLADNTNDINNYEKAMNQLKDILNQLSPTRATGSIKKREAYLTQITQDIKGYEDSKEGLKSIKNLYEAKQKEKIEITERRKTAAGKLRLASEESTKAEQKKQLNAILMERTEKDQELQKAKEIFPAEIPSKESLQNALEQVSVLDQASTTAHNFSLTKEEENQYQILSQRFENVNSSSEIDQKIEEQLSHMNDVANLKTSINDLHTKLSVQESIAAQQELMQPMEVHTKPEKTSAEKIGFFISIVGIVVMLLSIVIGITGLIRGGSPIIQTIIISVGALLVVTGRIFWKKAREAATIKQQRDEQQQREQQEQKRREIQHPAEEMKGQITKLTEQLQQELTGVKQFLETQDIYCEETAYQSKLYELKTLYHKEITDYQNLRDKKEKADLANITVNQIRRALDQYLSELQIIPEEDLKKQISNLQLAAETYRLAKRNFDQADNKWKQFEKEHDVESLKQFKNNHILENADSLDSEIQNGMKESEESQNHKETYNLDELNNIISEADTQLENIKKALDQYMSQMNELQEQLDLRDEKEQELADNQELQNQEKHKFKVLKMTQEYLQKAKEQFTARYMAPISNGFRKYYDMLTNQQTDQWMVDTNISVKIKEQGQLRETERLSAGWQDLIGICMRLALVDAMYQDEKPFLILDDPFVNLDDEKVERGNEMLKKVSQEYQTIYFTCHQSRVPY